MTNTINTKAMQIAEEIKHYEGILHDVLDYFGMTEDDLKAVKRCFRIVTSTIDTHTKIVRVKNFYEVVVPMGIEDGEFEQDVYSLLYMLAGNPKDGRGVVSYLVANIKARRYGEICCC